MVAIQCTDTTQTIQQKQTIKRQREKREREQLMDKDQEIVRTMETSKEYVKYHGSV